MEVFVNYDCDLQAPCLFERTVAALSSLSRLNEAELDRPQQVWLADRGLKARGGDKSAG